MVHKIICLECKAEFYLGGELQPVTCVGCGKKIAPLPPEHYVPSVCIDCGNRIDKDIMGESQYQCRACQTEEAYARYTNPCIRCWCR